MPIEEDIRARLHSCSTRAPNYRKETRTVNALNQHRCKPALLGSPPLRT